MPRLSHESRAETDVAGAGLKPAFLTSAQRGALFRALSRLESAGLPADRSIAAMGDLLGSEHARRFHGASALVARGATLAEAGKRFGLFSPRDYGLIRLAERGGSVARAAASLADAYAYRASVLGTLRSRLMLPLFVLVLGMFLAPLPALLGEHIDAAAYLLRALGPLLLLGVAAIGLIGMFRRLAARGLPHAAGRVALRMPVVGPSLRRLSRLELVEGLSMLLAAGVPAGEALDAALEALTNPAARRVFAPSLARIEQRGVSEALKDVGALEAEEFAIVSASEAAGRTVDGLDRIAAGLRDDFKQRLALASEWLPRGVYLVVAGVIGAGIIG